MPRLILLRYDSRQPKIDRYGLAPKISLPDTAALLRCSQALASPQPHPSSLSALSVAPLARPVPMPVLSRC